jgi:isoquinoline 1-oxidoreductase/isoquinoline 1-oxidoreductase beta subunit
VITRRALLGLGAAGAGSLAIGCAFGSRGNSIRRHFQRTGEFRPNAWIRILPDDTIVFTLDRVEMGQGTMTSQATLVAEELDVEPRALRIETAEADRAYDLPDRQLMFQITGGSTSTRLSWRPLRDAGAVAREMLRAAAAARWNVAIGECAAKDGAIVHAASNRRATYGELAGDASLQHVPRARWKPQAELRFIGTSIDRLDARPKVDGTAIYGIDVALPGMATAVLVRPPVRGSTLRAVPPNGVRVGEAVAFVAADYWQARKAADAAAVEWNDSPNARTDSEQLSADYRALLDRKGELTARSHGRAPRELAVDAVYELPYLAHATMEPMNATAWLHDGRLEVWAPTQAPGVARWRVAEETGLALDAVQIHTTMIGGGFGRRLVVDYVVEAALLAQKLGRPVKIVWSREDDMENDWYRPMAVSRVRGAVAGGTIAAWHHRLVTQSITASTNGRDFVGARVPNATPRPLRTLIARAATRMYARGALLDSTSVEGAADLPYAIDSIRVEYTPIETGVPVGFWRSVGHSHNAFVVESFFDELAHAAGADPFELRKKLLAKQPRHRRVLELAAAKAGWGTPLPAGVGRGIAVHFAFGSYCAQVIEASVERGRVIVHRVVCALDCGRIVNPAGVAAQVESAVIFALSAALKQRVTFKRGRVQETNFGSYKALRMFECPTIETHLVEGADEPSGVGEPGVPPCAPALCNAIFAATGRRIRRLPIERELERA